MARRWRRAAGWSAATLCVLLLVAASSVGLVGYTHSGRAMVLRRALPALNEMLLAGGLRVGRLDGMPLSHLVLEDVMLGDADGRDAVGAKRIEARYRLGALAAGEIDVEEVRIEGLELTAQRLRDGRVNLAALLRERPPAPDKPGASSPFALHVRNVHVEGTVRAAGLLPPPLDRAVIDVALDAEAHIENGTTRAQLRSLSVTVREPIAACFSTGGSVALGTEVSLQAIKAVLEADGAAVARLLPAGVLPGGALLGRYRLAVEAGGTLARLDARAHLDAPRGAADLTASVAPATGAWTAEAKISDLDLGEVWSLSPATSIALEARAQGTGATGSVDLAKLAIDVLGVHTEVRGRAGLDGDFDAHVTVDAPDLATLSAKRVALLPALPRLGGEARLKLHGTRASGIVRVGGTLEGEGLRLPGARVGRLDLKLAGAEPGPLALDVTAHGVTAAGVSLRSATLRADGDRRTGIAVHATARASSVTDSEGKPAERSAWLGARVVPVPGAGGGSAFEISLDDLGAKLGERRIALVHPARAVVGEVLRLDDLAIAAGELRLSVDASLARRSGAVIATVRAEHMDARELAELIAVATDTAAPPAFGSARAPVAASASTSGAGGREGGIPHTRATLIAHIVGTARSPRITASLEGTAEEAVAPCLGASSYRVHAALDHGQVSGDLSFDSGGPGAQLRFAAPLPPRPSAPLLLDGTIEVPAIDRCRSLLPPALASLAGRVSTTVRAGGTLRHPELDVVVEARSLVWSGMKDGESTVRVGLHQGQLRAGVDASARTGSGEPIGGLHLRAAAPLVLDLSALPRDLAVRLAQRTVVDLSAGVDALDLARVPWDELGMDPPARAGVVGVTVTSTGTLADPAVAVLLDGRELDIEGLHRRIHGAARLDWRGHDARVALNVGSAGHALASLRAGVRVSLAEVGARAAWRDAPVDLALDLPGLDLALATDLGGVVRGSVRARGTAGRPRLDASLAVEGLRDGELELGDVRLEARGGIDERRASLTARLAPRPAGSKGQADDGGELRIDASLPLAGDADVHARIRAVDLDLGFLAAAASSVRALEARLGADFTVSGRRERPRIDGTARIAGARLALDTQANEDLGPYDHIDVDARIHDGLIELRRLAVAQAKGRLEARGTARLDDAGALRSDSLEATVEATNFPLPAGSGAARLDALVRLRGDRDGAATRTVVQVERGGIRLPRLESAGSARDMGPLEDVTFVDALARREAARERRRAGLRVPSRGPLLALETHLPGPFYLSGPDVSGDLRGDLTAKLEGGRVSAGGTIELLHGVVRIAERPYEVRQATASLDGSDRPDPQLAVRLARAIQGATLFIEVSGTASRPRVNVRCEPALYDDTTLLTLIATGADAPSPKDKPVTGESLGARAVGLASDLLLRKLKDELGNYIPVEVLRLDLDYQNINVAPTARLEVGKYILDNLYLSYVYQSAPPNPQRPRNSHEAHLEYHFLKDYSLVSTVGDAGVAALDFFWNHRF